MKLSNRGLENNSKKKTQGMRPQCAYSNNSMMNTYVSGKLLEELNICEEAITRSVSLDFTVGSVLKQGEAIALPTSIKPQEMLLIVFEGEVKMPSDCFGIAYPRTRQSQRGLHVLNTGIVDPEYEGLLSTVIMNYSSQPIEIRKEDVFLRLMIYRSADNYKHGSGEKIEFEDYLDLRIEDSKKYPDTFLDIPKQVKKISNRVMNKLLNKLMLFVAVLTIVISIIVAVVGIIVPLIFN